MCVYTCTNDTSCVKGGKCNEGICDLNTKGGANDSAVNTPTELSSSDHSVNNDMMIKGIVGTVVGPVVLVLLAVAFRLFSRWQRRRRWSKKHESNGLPEGFLSNKVAPTGMPGNEKAQLLAPEIFSGSMNSPRPAVERRSSFDEEAAHHAVTDPTSGAGALSTAPGS